VKVFRDGFVVLFSPGIRRLLYAALVFVQYVAIIKFIHNQWLEDMMRWIYIIVPGLEAYRLTEGNDNHHAYLLIHAVQH